MKFFSRTTHYSRGFTLIEALLVLVLLGVITAISAPHFKGFFATQQLVNGTVFLEGVLQDAFSKARSEQRIFGIRVDHGSNPPLVYEITCPYDYVDGDVVCGGTPRDREESLLLWNEKPVLQALNLEVDRSGEILFAPPHGDIAFHSDFQGDPAKQAFQFTNTLGENKIISVYLLSGLISIHN